MPAAWLLILAIVIFILGYIFYGRYLSRVFEIDPKRVTPAHTKKDGMDYVPAKVPVLLGHHFASIAGAGPILGPIYAAVFGWIPVALWIIIGSLFIGSVHDFSSIVASIRHGGKSIGEVIDEHIGKSGKKLFLIFIWTVLVLIIAVFAKSVASVFIKEPSTSTSSALFMGLAVGFGLSVYRFHVPLWIATFFGVILLFGCVLLGLRFPIHQSFTFWIIILFIYVFIAATSPVWILLQPRDYLNSFLLYTVLLAGLAGVLIVNPEIHFEPVTRFRTELGPLFPLLFVTVACGAISGFHSLVSSGTTSKQLNRETDAKPVGMGSMLIEALLALVALITAVSLLQNDYARLISSEGGGPIGIFADGIGRWCARFGIPEKSAVTFAALAISAFALTTLDTATRLARYAFQEFFETKNRKTVLASNRYIGTLVTIVFSSLIAFSGTSETLWPLFGSANQLLASIVLLAITVWLIEWGKPTAFVRYPMIFMFCVTLTALASLVIRNFSERNIPLSILSVILFIVAAVLIFEAGKKIAYMRAAMRSGKIKD